MAAKVRTVYVCTNCGYESPKWMGRCPDCSEWNTMSEEMREPPAKAASVKGNTLPSVPPAAVMPITDIDETDVFRYLTHISEIDRVLGGGIVPGAAMLISGDPGIGKSTILMQIALPLSGHLKILYISGEESARQIKLRARRLGVDSPNLLLCCSTSLEQIVSTIEENAPDMVIVDSIQTVGMSSLSSSPGSVTQVRESAGRLIRMAKEQGFPLFLVGHVNKEGAIAGPKVLEHMVDTVLYFEGERNLPYRILRAVKNRFGATNEIGVFEMNREGLMEVPNPSALLLSGRLPDVPGSCVACVVEGSRPVLVEIQALAAKSAYNVPRRTATGFDYSRMAMLLAMLEKRGGYSLGGLDVYINVVGGLRIDDPAADLAVVAATISNLMNKELGPDIAAFGEVGLTGEVRMSGHIQARVGEAVRLGFRRIICPKQAVAQLEHLPKDVELLGVRTVGDIRRLLG